MKIPQVRGCRGNINHQLCMTKKGSTVLRDLRPRRQHAVCWACFPLSQGQDDGAALGRLMGCDPPCLRPSLLWSAGTHWRTSWKRKILLYWGRRGNQMWLPSSAHSFRQSGLNSMDPETFPFTPRPSVLPRKILRSCSNRIIP